VKTQEKILINPENIKCKIDYTGRRMKIYIKLNKEETAGWQNIKKGFDAFPGTDDELVKMMFFRGVNAFMDDLKEQVEGLSEEEKQDILAEVQEGETSQPVEAEVSLDDKKEN